MAVPFYKGEIMTEFESCQKKIMQCEQEISKGIIGQKDVIRQVMLAMLAGGNVLLEDLERQCLCAQSVKCLR